ncbi:hypothetical protein D1872_302740 [compost metagenome]
MTSRVEERVIRATAAVSPVPSTIVGMMMDSQFCGLKVGGSHCILIEKFKIKIRPCQKFGMDNPMSAININV